MYECVELDRNGNFDRFLLETIEMVRMKGFISISIFDSTISDEYDDRLLIGAYLEYERAWLHHYCIGL